MNDETTPDEAGGPPQIEIDVLKVINDASQPVGVSYVIIMLLMYRHHLTTDDALKLIESMDERGLLGKRTMADGATAWEVSPNGLRELAKDQGRHLGRQLGGQE